MTSIPRCLRPCVHLRHHDPQLNCGIQLTCNPSVRPVAIVKPGDDLLSSTENILTVILWEVFGGLSRSFLDSQRCLLAKITQCRAGMRSHSHLMTCRSVSKHGRPTTHQAETSFVASLSALVPRPPLHNALSKCTTAHHLSDQ